ncbi:MAG TPA: YciI family protein [Solirubrobacteraceae bacterium]|nr:YciI family protein [Solirubrobacteraceae bacterium]
MPAFVLRLIAPRPNFARTLTDSEREILGRHAAHWRPYVERGEMVAFGPVLTDDDSYGLAVVETDDEQALREFAAQDPVVSTGTAVFEFGRMAAGHVRGCTRACG